MKKKLIIAGITILITLASITAVWSLTSNFRIITGLGSVEWVNEAVVSQINQKGSETNSQIIIKLTSTADTVADNIYTVTLYLNDIETATDTISWAAGEIPGTQKKITFSGLDLSTINNYNIDVEK